MMLVGEQQPEACTRCSRQGGPFMGCYTVPGVSKGGCNNCHFTAMSDQCSYRATPSRSPPPRANPQPVPMQPPSIAVTPAPPPARSLPSLRRPAPRPRPAHPPASRGTYGWPHRGHSSANLGGNDERAEMADGHRYAGEPRQNMGREVVDWYYQSVIHGTHIFDQSELHPFTLLRSVFPLSIQPHQVPIYRPFHRQFEVSRCYQSDHLNRSHQYLQPTDQRDKRGR